MDIFIKIVKYLLCFTLIISLVMTAVCTIIKLKFLDSSYIESQIIDAEYVDIKFKTIDYSIKSECFNRGLPYDIFYEESSPVIDKSEISGLIKESVSGIVESLVYSKKYVKVVYGNNRLKAAIKGYLDENGDKLSIYNREEYINESAEYLADIVTANINVLNEDIVNSKLSLGKVIIFVSNLLFLFIIADIILLLFLLFINKKRLYLFLLNICVSCWIASTVLFIPSAIVQYNDLASKTIFAEGDEILASNLINYVSGAVFSPMLIFFIATLIGLLISLVLFVFGDKKNKYYLENF